MTSDEHGPPRRSPRRARQPASSELICQRVIEWIAYAKERLEGSGVRILTAPANDDPFAIDDVIAEHGGEVFVNVEGEVVEIAPGHELISTGYTNETPWHTPREYPEEVIGAQIKEMASRLERPESAVFNLHPPPHNSQLDLAPELDDELAVDLGRLAGDGPGGLEGGPPGDRGTPAAALAPRAHPRVARLGTDRTHHWRSTPGRSTARECCAAP